MSVNAKTAHGALLASALVLCGVSGILLGSCSTGQPSAQESANQSAYETAASAEGNVLSRAASVPEPASAAVDAAGSVRIGKDQVTVLVLNGCGVEGAAAEVAEKVRGAGFENVTVDNATYFNAALTRVSYYHKENSAEAEELAELLKVVGPGSVYCYDSDQSGGWSEDYDILVLVGDPSVGGFAPQGAQGSAGQRRVARRLPGSRAAGGEHRH